MRRADTGPGAVAGFSLADPVEDFAACIRADVIGSLLDVPAAERGPLRDRSLPLLPALEPAPGEARTDRPDITRRPHVPLAFGQGAHACSGIDAARRQALAAIGRPAAGLSPRFTAAEFDLEMPA